MKHVVVVVTQPPHKRAAEKLRMAAAYKERLDAYVAYFNILLEEQKTLEELYAPVKARLAAETGSAQGLEFSIRWRADMAAWLKRGSSLFDQRKTLPYGTFSELSKAAQQILAPAWSSGSSSTSTMNTMAPAAKPMP